MPTLPQDRSKPGRSGSITRRQAMAGAGSILGGAGVYAGVVRSDAFTTGVLERLSSISIADDENAALGLTGFSTEETPTFTNNLDADLTLTLSAPDDPSAEFDVGGTGSFEDPATFTLGPGNQEIVEMTADVDQITVLIEGTFADGSLTMERDYEISQADQIDLTANVDSTGASGKFSFGVANNGSTEAYVDSVRVDSTSTQAVEVASGDIFSVDSSDDPNVTPRQLVSEPLAIDDATGNDLPLTAFDGGDTVAIRPSAGETVFEFDRFEDVTGLQVDMRGATVDVTLGLTDGSTAEFNLVDN